MSMMDTNLLGTAVEYHGPMLIRYLKDEDQLPTEAVLNRLRGFDAREFQSRDPELASSVQKFVAKKADLLFRSVPEEDETWTYRQDEEDMYAKLPPLETFMGVPPHLCKKHFYNSLEKRDIVIGIVSNVLESGLVLTILCLDNGRARDIDELKISAFCPAKELPRLFAHQSALDGFQVKDYVRGVVLSVNPETERIIVSLLAKTLPDDVTHPKMGLITDEEFPVHYRRKLHMSDLTFNELLHSVLGFQNIGNIKSLLHVLNQEENVSLMDGLRNMEIPEKDSPENLRKYQNNKLAHKRVADGIALFKSGKHLEALQLLNKALQIDAFNVEAMVARGALYANNESFSQAIKDFKEALKVNAQHSNARNYLYETLLAQGRRHEDNEQLESAEDFYREAMAVKLDSQDAKEALRKLSLIKSRKLIKYKDTDEYSNSSHMVTHLHDGGVTPGMSTQLRHEEDKKVTKRKKKHGNENDSQDYSRRQRRQSSTERMADTLKQLIAEDEISGLSEGQHKRGGQPPQYNIRSGRPANTGSKLTQEKFREGENHEIRTISISNKGPSISSPASWHNVMSGDMNRDKERNSKNQAIQKIKRNETVDAEHRYYSEYRSITVAPATEKQRSEFLQKIPSYKSPTGRIGDDRSSGEMRDKHLEALSVRQNLTNRGSTEKEIRIVTSGTKQKSDLIKEGVIETSNVSQIFVPRKVDARYKPPVVSVRKTDGESSDASKRSDSLSDTEHDKRSRRKSLPDTLKQHSSEKVLKMEKKYPGLEKKNHFENFRRSKLGRSESRGHEYRKKYSRSRSRSHSRSSRSKSRNRRYHRKHSRSRSRGLDTRRSRRSYSRGRSYQKTRSPKKVGAFNKQCAPSPRRGRNFFRPGKSEDSDVDSMDSLKKGIGNKSSPGSPKRGNRPDKCQTKNMTDLEKKNKESDPAQIIKKSGLTIVDLKLDMSKWESPEDGNKKKTTKKNRWDREESSDPADSSKEVTNTDAGENTTSKKKDEDTELSEEVMEITPEVEEMPFWLFDKNPQNTDREDNKIPVEQAESEEAKTKTIDTEKFVFKKHRHSDLSTETTEYNFFKVKKNVHKDEKNKSKIQQTDLRKSSDKPIEKISQKTLKTETDVKSKIDKKRRHSSPQHLGFFGLVPAYEKDKAETGGPVKEMEKQISLVEYGSPNSPADSDISEHEEIIKHVDIHREQEKEKIRERSSSTEHEKYKRRKKRSKSRSKKKKSKIVSLAYISDSGSSGDSYNSDSTFSPHSSPYSSASEKRSTSSKGKIDETLSGLESFLSDLKAKKKQQWIDEGKLKPSEN